MNVNSQEIPTFVDWNAISILLSFPSSIKDKPQDIIKYSILIGWLYNDDAIDSIYLRVMSSLGTAF